jgi:hypothetical protein
LSLKQPFLHAPSFIIIYISKRKCQEHQLAFLVICQAVDSLPSSQMHAYVHSHKQAENIHPFITGSRVITASQICLTGCTLSARTRKVSGSSLQQATWRVMRLQITIQHTLARCICSSFCMHKNALFVLTRTHYHPEKELWQCNQMMQLALHPLQDADKSKGVNFLFVIQGSLCSERRRHLELKCDTLTT